jgi:hypothetical protein
LFFFCLGCKWPHSLSSVNHTASTGVFINHSWVRYVDRRGIFCVLIREVKGGGAQCYIYSNFIFVSFILLCSYFRVLLDVVQIFTLESVGVLKSCGDWEWSLCVVTIFTYCLFSGCRFWQWSWFFLSFGVSTLYCVVDCLLFLFFFFGLVFPNNGIRAFGSIRYNKACYCGGAEEE